MAAALDPAGAVSSPGNGGSGRWAARMREPAYARKAAAPNATKIPHSIPDVVADGPAVVAPCLSKIRQMINRHVHSPAPKITPPSPPGRWNARPSARWNSSVSTPAATSRTAASTNENAPQPVIEALADCSVFVFAGAMSVT